MNAAPRGVRLHIGTFGRRGVGKSSLLRALTRQQVSTVSPEPGTTADPVEKPMELMPLGPVLFIDTAGIDDVGALSAPRAEQTMKVLDRTELAVLVLAEEGLGSLEIGLLDAFEQRKIPVLPVLNKTDLSKPDEVTMDRLLHHGLKPVALSATTGKGLPELREALVALAPDEFLNAPTIVSDLVAPGECAVLVVPIDKEAPRGRLILPQAQAIRDLLDHDACALVVKERELREALARLTRKPALVVTDSQAFPKVAADIPTDVPMTSFSILFARQKGDLLAFARGALAIDSLRPGDRVAVAEACSHHPIGEDIGRTEIPRWLGQHIGGPLEVEQVQGRDFVDEPTRYKLVIHCGACMLGRREMLSRIFACQRAGVPITNYGMAIAHCLGVIERALQPFPAAIHAYREGAAARPNAR
ncbi:MAG: [FeFe] hydrogenase H-cluster maturation GTPase HydF [Deltaproteobacteria bacterium]|jgi:[FeFe] hydrogenase H-cluster maturation GTPase HydF|nr:[FeFe] hydrogenase H-cluster maturation GTPase HydF [Deltaproteobacteria bacterium]